MGQKTEKAQNRRDTFVATVSFTGRKLPIFAIKHQPRKTEEREINGIKFTVETQKQVSGMNKKEILNWVEYFLPYTQPGDVLIMDNLNVHKNKKIH